jgi:hypothetical protein
MLVVVVVVINAASWYRIVGGKGAHRAACRVVVSPHRPSTEDRLAAVSRREGVSVARTRGSHRVAVRTPWRRCCASLLVRDSRDYGPLLLLLRKQRSCEAEKFTILRELCTQLVQVVVVVAIIMTACCGCTLWLLLVHLPNATGFQRLSRRDIEKKKKIEVGMETDECTKVKYK